MSKEAVPLFQNEPEKVTNVDVIVVAPHPDDAELGMGGTILKMVDQGITVGVVDMSDGEPTPYGSPEIRARETARATELLRLAWRVNLGLPNRSIQPTLEARALLAGVFRLGRPKAVFCPYWEDAHPDHWAVTEIAEAARFWAKLTKTNLPGDPYYPPRLYYYYCTHLRKPLTPSFIVDISDVIDRKLDVVRCYESQVIVGRPVEPLSFLDQLKAIAASLGWFGGCAYGEGFAVKEGLCIRDLRAFLLG